MKRPTCRSCGRPGHNVRTCGKPRPLAPHIDQPPHRRRFRAALEPFSVTTAEANRLLRRLRPFIKPCSAEGRRFLDSLMLSCYLQGLLEGAQKAEAAA